MTAPPIFSLLRRLPVLLGAWLLLLLPLAGQAQTTAPGQAFELVSSTGRVTRDLCIGQTYTIRDRTPNLPAGLIYAYGFDLRNGLSASVITTTYPAPGAIPNLPGRYRFFQIISNLTTGRNDTVSQVYTIYDVRMPRIRVERCQRSVAVTLTDPAYSTYRVGFGTAPVVTAAQGTTIFSPLQTATATTLRIVVTGAVGMANCTPIPLDTVVRLIPAPNPRIRRLDVLAPTNSRRVWLQMDSLRPTNIYVIERANLPTPSTAWVVLDTLRPTADTATRILLNAPLPPHRYRLRQLNAVCVTGAPNPNILSNEAGTNTIKVTVNSGSNRVEWTAYPGPGRVLHWNLMRDGRRLIKLSPLQLAFSDIKIRCQQSYCYEAVAAVLPDPQNLADTLLAAGADSCATGIRTRAVPAPRLKASFDLSNNLVLTATPPGQEIASGAEFTETLAGGTPTIVGTSPVPTLTLVAPDTARLRGACYRTIFTDSCLNRSASSTSACPMLLRVRRTPDRTKARLTWTPYVGITPFYTVFILDERTNALLDSVYLGLNILTYDDPLAGNTQQIRRYRIRAQFLGNASTNVYSNFVDLTESQTVRLPNAFTPNGDDLNDTFGPVGRYELRESELTIYDRWGRQIFQTREANKGWDGRPTGGGAVVPTGVFLYQFRGRDALGQEFSQRGTVTVLP